MLGDTYEITVEDLEGALKKQNITLQPGDAIIIGVGVGSPACPRALSGVARFGAADLDQAGGG
jgi:hypothetical protein